MNRLVTVIAGAWFGGALFAGMVAAPVIFDLVADRALAGSIAGRLFFFIDLTGLAVVVIIAGWQIGGGGVHAIFSRTGFWLALALVTILFQELVLGPMMAAVKAAPAGLRDEGQFALVHGLSAGLFLATVVAAFGLFVTTLESSFRRRSG